MIQRDYFMRMTQMLATVLAKVIFNKDQKNFEDAQGELENAGKTIVGIDLRLIRLLGNDDVLNLMKASDLYAGRCLVSAKLLKEYADVLASKGDDESRKGLYEKSMLLYSEAIRTGEIPDSENYYAEIDELCDEVTSFDSSALIAEAVFRYYDFSGQFAKAEDILFEMSESKSESTEKLGLKFYERLRSLPDEELEKGNFSREEVDAGLNEFLNLKN